MKIFYKKKRKKRTKIKKKKPYTVNKDWKVKLKIRNHKNKD
jgi:hypothetical protein